MNKIKIYLVNKLEKCVSYTNQIYWICVMYKCHIFTMKNI